MTPPSAERLRPRLTGGAVGLLLAVAACGPSLRLGGATPTSTTRAPAPARADAAYVLPPADAFRRGLMPLASTGVLTFRQDHPAWDGRGVLIAILDSGLDPGPGGFATTSTGAPKLLDLRDFSGEGRIPLRPITPVGDSVTVAGHTLGGFGRMRIISAGGPWFGGILRESSLGPPPASDVNWNGRVGDSLVVVVARATDGWILLADTDGDGSLANERPVHDYLVAHETFGWAPSGTAPALTLAANFADGPGGPLLDLFFDTSGHGSHVAGIAAGHDLYGVAGFDGVAPGAQLIGLKIADDAHGGISVTGSMVRALDYAIRFATDRRLPLVVNLSFGVGNEREGAAVIDRLIDSVLALHPAVTFIASAGNDGPGVSTLGFPGSARRVLSVGATLPPVFFGRPAGTPGVLAYFSSRGGEVAGPAVVAPGVAYSNVPRWHRGNEVLQGTSMASPHVAGLAAILASALLDRGRPISARAVRQALMATAQPLASFTDIDQGAGLPDITRAWAWLEGAHPIPEVTATADPPGPDATDGALWWTGLPAGDSAQATFTLSRPAGDSAPLLLTFRSDAQWLVPPPAVTLRGRPVRVVVRYRRSELAAPGLYADQVTGWGPDPMAGPLVRLDNSVIVPLPAADDLLERPTPIQAGGQRRWFFRADSARPFRVEISVSGSRSVAGAFLHEPGGMPFRGGHELEASGDGGPATFQPDGRDVVPGVYEVDAVAPPSAGTAAGVRIVTSPVQLSARREGAGVTAEVRNLGDTPRSVALTARLVGAERGVSIFGRGSAPVVVPFVIPRWARSLQVDLLMAREQWARFTDFGVTVFDSMGHTIDDGPLNYAFGRMSVQIPPGGPSGPAAVTLYPGLATASDTATWSSTMLIRLYADPDSGQLLGPPGGTLVAVSPRGTSAAIFPVGTGPWTLGDGFAPLTVVSARTGQGPAWTREFPLPALHGPLMR